MTGNGITCWLKKISLAIGIVAAVAIGVYKGVTFVDRVQTEEKAEVDHEKLTPKTDFEQHVVAVAKEHTMMMEAIRVNQEVLQREKLDLTKEDKRELLFILRDSYNNRRLR